MLADLSRVGVKGGLFFTMGCCASTSHPKLLENWNRSTKQRLLIEQRASLQKTAAWAEIRQVLQEEFKRMFPTIELEIRLFTMDGTFERTGDRLSKDFRVFGDQNSFEYILTDRKQIKYTLAYSKEDPHEARTLRSSPPHESAPHESNYETWPPRIRFAIRSLMDFHVRYLCYHNQRSRPYSSNSSSMPDAQRKTNDETLLETFDPRLKLITNLNLEQKLAGRRSRASNLSHRTQRMQRAESTESAESAESTESAESNRYEFSSRRTIAECGLGVSKHLYAEEALFKTSPRSSTPPSVRHTYIDVEMRRRARQSHLERNSAPAQLTLTI